MIDIAARMRELIPLLAKGVNGIVLDDVKPDYPEGWSPDYATVKDVYYMTAGMLFGEDDRYFDYPQADYDIRQFVLAHFREGTTERVEMPDDNKQGDLPVGTVVVCNYGQMIEVYRVKEARNERAGDAVGA